MEVTITHHKSFEKNVKKYVNLLIYAVFNDLERVFDTPLSITLQSFNNLIKPAAEQHEGLTPRFSILENVNQFIRFIFFQMIEEIKLAPINNNDTIDTINEKVAPNCLECMLSFVLNVARKAPAFEATLSITRDETNWLHTQFVNFLPKVYLPLNILVSSFSSTFDTFLKCIARSVGAILWYTGGRQVTEWLLLGILTDKGMPALLICDIQDNIRTAPKKPRKPPTAKGDKNTVPPNNNPHIDTVSSDVMNDLINML